MQPSDASRRSGQSVRTSDSWSATPVRERLSELLARTPSPSAATLAGAVARELRERIAHGEPVRLEQYLERFPVLREDPELLADLVYAEYCARKARGETPGLDDYAQRFPSLQNSLARLFCLHSMLASNPSALSWLARSGSWLPEPGERFLDFELVKLLGQGAFARVYLARQSSLANRLVVVKITSGPTHEHETLARLAHPNIVPIYSVHRDEATGLTAICMPYQAAVSMATVATAWAGGNRFPRTASAWLTGAEARLKDLPAPSHVPSWTDRFPAERDFVYATAWLMRHAASALGHAHKRNILHLDLKPSNLLITADGQPLLVDFNLSWTNLMDDGHQTLVIGGTLPYMPPEQIEALRRGREAPAAERPGVGPRSDLFSLAATFYELLTGALPFGTPEPIDDRDRLLATLLDSRLRRPEPLRRRNPAVPPDLDYLLLKCLAADPEHRLSTAEELVSALDEFLADRIIPGYPRRSPLLRSKRFLWRNRRRLALSAVGAATVAAIGLATWYGLKQDEPQTAPEWFARGAEAYSAQDYAKAVEAMRKALELGYENPAIAHYYIGAALASMDRDAEAVAEYTRAIELDPTQFYAYIARSLVYSTSKTSVRNLDAALADAERALALLQRYPPGSVSPEWFIETARCFASVARQLDDPAARKRYFARAADLVRQAQQAGLSRDQIERIVEHHGDQILEGVIQEVLVARESN